MKTWRNVIHDIYPKIEGNDIWESLLDEVISVDTSSIGIHLAIFTEPYLGYILDGRKTVESRFGVKRIAPYGQVSTGDILLLKKTGGPIVGLCKVSNVWFYNLNPDSWKKLRKEFSVALCALDPEFWAQRELAAFATLMRINAVKSIRPVAFHKRDRRGWVVLRSSHGNEGQYLS